MDPALLWARAFLLAFVACFLGVTGHVTADGLLPGPGWLVVLLVVGTLLSLPLLARPASGLRLVVLLVGGQTLVHLFLTVTAGHTGDRVEAPVAHHSGRILPTVDGHRIGTLQDQYDAMIGSATAQPALPVGHLVSDLSAHAPMMAVHLLAAALVGLWLAVGERSLWTLVALATAVLLRLVTPLLPVLPERGLVTLPAEPVGLAAPHRLTRSVVRRGPPALLAAA
ncbi:hypothetical protein GCM10023146_44360 [Nocardioides caricicola]